jgi:hypothetical protein
MPYFGIPIRNGLPIGLGSVAGFGVSEQFSPASLFSAGEQGAWYDPSDLSTLFQDSAGTTPVTAVEQSVGLMLDKSKGGRQSLPITGWVKDSGDGVVTVNGGTITITGATTTTRVDILAPGWAIGNLGDITINGTVSGAVSPFVFIGGSPFAIVAGTNTYQSLISGSNLCRVQVASGSATFDVTSRGYVPGNHAYQSTSTSRPVLRARYNLLTYSEQFDNAAWTRDSCTISANATTAPDGTLTADKIVSASATAATGVSQSITASAVAHTASYYVKAAEATFVQLLWSGARSAEYVNFNLSTGTISGGSYTSASITAAANGFWRITLTSTFGSAGSAPSFLWLIDSGSAGRAASYTGNGTNGLFVWGAQLIVTNSLTSNAYQRIAAATDYDTSGFLPYLAFDGTDDSLLTNSVDFTATDKMTVWAGVRKLSDAQSIINELSSSIANAGSYALSGADLSTSGAKYGFYLNGTTISGFSASTYTAPITNVLSVAYDIAGADRTTEIYPRINGVIPTLTGVDSVSAGTGNFANAPLYIGRRNNATLPFNGNLYSLIIRGAQSSAAQISSTESWVNGKTEAY